MNGTSNDIVEQIGKEQFKWLMEDFDKQTRLSDIPDEILRAVASVDVTIRDYSRSREALVAIALITFAYRLGQKVQQPQYGSDDIMFSKVLAKNELARREGRALSGNPGWELPLYELITGEVGDRIRATKFVTNPT